MFSCPLAVRHGSKGRSHFAAREYGTEEGEGDKNEWTGREKGKKGRKGEGGRPLQCQKRIGAAVY